LRAAPAFAFAAALAPAFAVAFALARRRAAAAERRTRHVHVAAVGSTLPAASVARTRKVCHPYERPVYVFGEEQAA
jgi:hypothetical protein